MGSNPTLGSSIFLFSLKKNSIYAFAFLPRLAVVVYTLISFLFDIHFWYYLQCRFCRQMRGQQLWSLELWPAALQLCTVGRKKEEIITIIIDYMYNCDSHAILFPCNDLHECSLHRPWLHSTNPWNQEWVFSGGAERAGVYRGEREERGEGRRGECPTVYVAQILVWKQHIGSQIVSLGHSYIQSHRVSCPAYYDNYDTNFRRLS